MLSTMMSTSESSSSSLEDVDPSVDGSLPDIMLASEETKSLIV